MRHLNRRSTQSGVVLVIGLMLLLIITIVAVASMSSTHMQERMAGNARTQTLAFEVASAGASDSLKFYHDNLDPAMQCSEPESWDQHAFSDTELGPDDPPRYIGHHRVQLTQHLYCLNLNAGLRPQYFVLSVGEVLAGDTSTVIARRAVEVRVARLGGDADCGALCFPGCADGNQYRFPTSMSFEVDGDTNPAITLPEECRDEVRDAIRDNVIGNYEGGISGYVEPLPPPWTKPATVDKFRQELLGTMLAGVTTTGPSFALDTYGETPPPSSTSSISTNGTAPNYSWEFIQPPTDGPNTGTHVVTLGSTAQYGTSENPQITYIAGDADMRGGVSGAGILVVEGNLEWRGTPPFEGLILVLGGKYKVGGGGTGGNFAGSLVVVNIWDEHDPNSRDGGYYSHWYTKDEGYLSDNFGKTELDFRGGGTALYQYDCGYLQDLAGKLPETSAWEPQCGGAESGETLERIISWRESIGWRVDFVD